MTNAIESAKTRLTALQFERAYVTKKMQANCSDFRIAQLQERLEKVEKEISRLRGMVG